MQAGVGLFVSDVMPIYMIIPRYSHNYAQLYQLLNSNLSPTVEYLCSWEKPLVKLMAPGSILHHISLPSTSYFCRHLLCNLYYPIYTKKYQKYLSYYLYQISLLQVVVKGLTTPLSRWLQGSWLFVQVLGDFRVVSYWIDTFVLKNWGKYLRYSATSSLPLRGKPTQAQDVVAAS